jgi:hypothetical protein
VRDTEQSRTESWALGGFMGRDQEGTLRGITKTMLRTCAGLAVAAGLVVGGTGVASAATTSPTTQSTSSHGFSCNPYARQQWNLNGRNYVKAVYLGSTYTYSVKFRQSGGCLTGTLTDPYYPTTGPIYGTVFKNHVTFRFLYPAGSVQGLRTYTGTINRRGNLSGTWSQTGSQGGGGTFTLAKKVRHACSVFYWWNPNRSCSVHP